MKTATGNPAKNEPQPQQQQQQQQQQPSNEKNKPSTKCLEMQAFALISKISPVACESDGRFSALQVDLNLGYAWCVNQDSGMEVYGTRQLGGKPIKCPGTDSKSKSV